MPSWPNRFQNNAFKKYIEEIILKEMPAHVYSYIKWLSFDEMQEFEMIYQKYSDSLSVKSLKDKEASLETLLLNLISPVRHG